MRFKII